jgi:hypothetical protein
VAEVFEDLLVGHVRLSQQCRVPAAPVNGLTQLTQEGVVRWLPSDRAGPFRFDDERHGVDPVSRSPDPQPCVGDLLDLRTDGGVLRVEVGLEVVEPVPVPRAGHVVIRPGLGLHTREHLPLEPVRGLGL